MASHRTTSLALGTITAGLLALVVLGPGAPQVTAQTATASASASASGCKKAGATRSRKAARRATRVRSRLRQRRRRCSTSGGGSTSQPTVGATQPTVSSGGSSGGGSYTPPSDPPGNPDCPLSEPNSTIDLTLPSSCTVVASDTGSNPNPIPFWGKIDAAASSRHQQLTSGGDAHATGTGGSQGDASFRRMTAFDGDDVWGERAELGFNWWEASDPGAGMTGPGPTVFYHEGMRRVTFASVRMPASSPVGNSNWRTVMQMKQAQPYAAPSPGSMFELQQRDGVWLIVNDWNDVWSAPAQQNTWTRFAFDIVYSQNPSIGSIKVYVDLDGDGDASDSGEQSPRVHRQTLRTEVEGGVLPAGSSIPSHLRAGIYQNTNYSCPSGCSVDIDNVQVVKA